MYGLVPGCFTHVSAHRILFENMHIRPEVRFVYCNEDICTLKKNEQ